MKYVLVMLLLVGCARTKVVEEKKVEPKKINRHERLLKCVDRYIDKDVVIKEAFEVCKGIYKRG